MSIEFPSAATKYPSAGHWSHVETKARQEWHKLGLGPAFPTEVADGPQVPVEVNWGRWLARCPNPDCNSAAYVDPDDRKFMCMECWNHKHGGKWLPTEWPSDPPGIEALLKVRLHDHNRSWRPGETKKDLRRENERLRGAGVRGTE